MPTLKFVMNIRAGNDMNTSTALEFIVNDVVEAEDAGRQAYELATAFNTGFNKAGEEA